MRTQVELSTFCQDDVELLRSSFLDLLPHVESFWTRVLLAFGGSDVCLDARCGGQEPMTSEIVLDALARGLDSLVFAGGPGSEEALGRFNSMDLGITKSVWKAIREPLLETFRLDVNPKLPLEAEIVWLDFLSSLEKMGSFVDDQRVDGPGLV